MEDKHKCKLCSRKFLNGKALGGHMRSHLMALPLPALSENEENSKTSINYALRENPKRSFRMIDQFFDRESESSESTRTKPRSKRSRRRNVFVINNKDKSLVDDSDSDSEESVAMCLMMLSRNFMPKYQCEICHRSFKCSQALGSHRTTHKNNNYSEERPLKKVVDQKLHECPFCGKFFQSGQGLGGHKRTHLIITCSTTTASSSSSKLGDSFMDSNSAKLPNGFIDLNMPAPMDEEDFSDADFQQEHGRG